jgi:hypothetical protein
VPDLEEWLKERDLLTKLIQQQLLRAQQRMKSHVDKKRSERGFQVGDLVYLKVQPYIQMTVASRSNQKLSFCFFGPFKILQRVGRVAYKLDLPFHTKIHPVVHVSQLKQHIPPHTEVSPDFPTLPSDPMQQLVPEAVLDQRVIVVGSSSIHQLLVHWSDLPSTLATNLGRSSGCSSPFSSGSSLGTSWIS